MVEVVWVIINPEPSICNLDCISRFHSFSVCLSCAIVFESIFALFLGTVYLRYFEIFSV